MLRSHVAYIGGARRHETTQSAVFRRGPVARTASRATVSSRKLYHTHPPNSLLRRNHNLASCSEYYSCCPRRTNVCILPSYSGTSQMRSSALRPNKSKNLAEVL
ncbi:unnamed protein product [Ectocarpus sp. 13 AM-2016]